MKKAFSLIELIFVVTVIGLVAAVCIPAIHTSLRDARLSEALSHARVLEAAKDSYKMVHPFVKGNVTQADLAKYYPAGYSSTDKTPWKTDFSNTLNLNEPVSFVYNGKTYYSNQANSQ